MTRKSVLSCGALTIAVLFLCATAQAQIGSGWTQYSPTSKLQLVGCGTQSSSGGVETFKLTCSSTSGEQRAERRVQDEFSSGSNQFEGYLRVVSFGGNNVCVKQTFQPQSGAFLMVGVHSGGTLYQGGDTLASGIIGSTIRVNTITVISGLKTTVYVNGSLKSTKTGGTPPFHNKYGTYRFSSGNGPITAEWSNVRFWKNGSASGGTSPTPTPTPTPVPNATATPTPTPVPNATATPTPTPIPGGGGVSFEAESVSVTNSGTGTSVQTDTNCSGGTWISLDAENTGSWFEFTTPSIPAGTYSLSMSYKTNNNRGQLTMRVDGTQVGGTIDQYGSPSTYPTANFGTVTFSSTGTHKLRMAVAGKNSSSSSYVLSADKFTLQ